MNWDQVRGKWMEMKGEIKQRWGKLTDDDLTVINGKREALAGKLIERYGKTKEQVEVELAELEKKWDAVKTAATAKPVTPAKPGGAVKPAGTSH